METLTGRYYADEADVRRRRRHRRSDEGDAPVVLGVVNLSAVFLLLAGGLALALVSFLAELLAFRSRHRIDAILDRIVARRRRLGRWRRKGPRRRRPRQHHGVGGGASAPVGVAASASPLLECRR